MSLKSRKSDLPGVFRASELSARQGAHSRGQSVEQDTPGLPDSPADDVFDQSAPQTFQRSSDTRQKKAGRRSGNRAGISLKARAVRYLSIRDHSREELFRKLSPYAKHAFDALQDNEDASRPDVDFQAAQELQAVDVDRLNALLDELEREGWQSDKRYAQSLEDSQSKRFGRRRVASTMRERGLDDRLIRETLERLKDSEPQRAWEVWNKRFGQKGKPSDAREYARQARFLASRGFGGDVVARLLSGRYDPTDDPDHDLDNSQE